jgi:glycosyltransferase involved in cell wall biosynthesis
LHEVVSNSFARQRDTDETKVSVCMAVYNGAEFLMPQVESILGQLQPIDELLIVDDASQDSSPSILCRIRDPRVQVHRNARNLGVLATVERSLKLAGGGIVFLSDQDDVWLSGKVEKVISVFLKNPEVTLVATDATLIDENGTRIADSFYARRGRFSSGLLHNLVKNKYLGCTLAFRRRMLEYFLPIPADVPMHDMWFGLLNSVYGMTYFVNEPLTAYRRHDRNVSPSEHARFGRMMLWRWRLVRNLINRIVEHANKRHLGEDRGTK